MERVLFITHTNSTGEVPGRALEALEEARRVADAIGDGGLRIGLVGSDVQSFADRLAGAGAERLLAVEGAEYSESRYATDVAALAALVERAEATIVVAPHTRRMARALPGAAARAGGKIDTQVDSLQVQDGAIDATRWFYRRRIRGTFTRTARPWLMTVSPATSSPRELAPGSATVERLDVPPGDPRTRVIGNEAIDEGSDTIRPDAELLLVAGAGWTKKQGDGTTKASEAETLITTFLEKSGASLGSSKSLVDQSSEGAAVLSFMSHLHQVGQTGSTPRHPKGLATCCHGEEPHVVGWRFIEDRRAVNLDAGCGWARGKADVLYVADAFEVMRRVNALLAGQ